MTFSNLFRFLIDAPATILQKLKVFMILNVRTHVVVPVKSCFKQIYFQCRLSCTHKIRLDLMGEKNMMYIQLCITQ